MIRDAIEEARIIMKTEDDGEGGRRPRRKMATGTVITLDGTELFQIVPTRWSKWIVIGYSVMLLIIVILTYLIYNNQSQINRLEKTVETEIMSQ